MKKYLHLNDIMVNYKGKFASRKGMGMELALLVLFVVFACSTLLVSSAMLGKSNLNDRKDQMIQRAQVDMFAEKLLDSDPNNDNSDCYKCEWSDDKDILTIKDQETGEILLTVTIADNKVVSWGYH